MAVQDTLPFAVICTLFVTTGTTTSYADDDPCDGINPGNGCNQTRQTCWDQVFCAHVQSCVDDDHNSGQDFYQCLLEAVGGHEVCSCNVCPDSYVANQAAPSNQDCIDQYDARKEYCEFDGPNSKICGYGSRDLGVGGTWGNYLISACKKAAYEEYLTCLSHAVPNISPSAFQQATFLNGATAAGVWRPALGTSDATMLLVPLDDQTGSVDNAVVKSLLWDGEGYTWTELGEFERGADMCTEVVIDLNQIPEALFTSDLDLFVVWRDGEESVLGLDYFLPIAESGIPGDFNRDGERNAADLSAFIDAYDHNAPRADRNGDGVVNATDLELFLVEYDAG